METKSEKQRWIFVLLAIIFGTLGIHNFYIGHPFRGACQLLLTLLSFGYLSWLTFGISILEAIFVSEDGNGKTLS